MKSTNSLKDYKSLSQLELISHMGEFRVIKTKQDGAYYYYYNTISHQFGYIINDQVAAFQLTTSSRSAITMTTVNCKWWNVLLCIKCGSKETIYSGIIKFIFNCFADF